MMKLKEALEIKAGEVVSLVGGGGKTTLMFAFARELPASRPVITTTTTRIFEPSPGETGFLLVERDEVLIIHTLIEKMDRYHHITIARERLAQGKLKGISPELVDRIARLEPAPFIIVEADGAARRSLKAPGSGEPVIPLSTSLAIPVAGIDVIGRPLTEENFFRAETAAQLLGLSVGEVITLDMVATLITHPRGLIKDIPVHTRIIPFVNKVDSNRDLPLARELAARILEKNPRIERVVLGQARNKEPVLEVFLGKVG